MKRRVMTVCITFFFAIALPIGLYFLYVHSGEKTRHEATLTYLKEHIGYDQNEIKSVEVEHTLMSLILSYDPWIIIVVFEDEPNAIYYYHYEDGVISQSGLSGSTPDELYLHIEDAPPDIKKSDN